FHHNSDKTWGVVLFGLIAFFSAIWVSLFSINWTRYLFPGWVFSLLLLGNLIWNFFSMLLEKNKSGFWISQWKPVALAMMAVVVGLTSYGFILKNKGDDSAELMAKFIRENIPQDKVIETWEWQIDAPSQHWKIHHPSSSYQTLAIEQRFVNHKDFDLGYDFQEYPADYLLVGSFSDWTQIYNQRDIENNFKQVAQFGPYRLYQRLF
ncbi:MAG TPA: hypothetical protein VMT46_14060, partial [Anaerolineaceae bacterium]|nr:hypothetical protein [Anaerolineaceae bacterium]